MHTSTLPAAVEAAVSQAPSRPTEPSLTALDRTLREQIAAVGATLATLQRRIPALGDRSAEVTGLLMVYQAAANLQDRLDALLPIHAQPFRILAKNKKPRRTGTSPRLA